MGEKKVRNKWGGDRSNSHWDNYIYGCLWFMVLDLSAVFMWDSIGSKKFTVP